MFDKFNDIVMHNIKFFGKVYYAIFSNKVSHEII